MTTRTLTADETARWDDDATFRATLHRTLTAEAKPGAHVEVYSHDGVTLDAWDVENETRAEAEAAAQREAEQLALEAHIRASEASDD